MNLVLIKQNLTALIKPHTNSYINIRKVFLKHFTVYYIQKGTGKVKQFLHKMHKKYIAISLDMTVYINWWRNLYVKIQEKSSISLDL